MARKVSINGKRTGIPGQYSKGIEPAGPLSPAPLEQGVVAIIATSDGPLKPQSPMLLRSARGVDALGLGNLGKGIKVLFRPSREDKRLVRGASAVLAVRPEKATQASLDIDNGSAAKLFPLQSVAYGLLASGLAAEIKAGTAGGPGRKLIVSESGKSDETFDDLGFLPALIVRYTGDGTTATITITDTQITTALAGQTDGSANLTVPFGTYNTVKKIADYINQQTGYEAVIVTARPNARLGKDLDYLSATDIKTASGAITLADATTTTFTGTITGLADGDVIKVEDEYLYVTDAATKAVLRGYLDSTPVAHAAKTGTVYTGLTETTKRVMEAATDSSSRVLAGARTTATGLPAVMAKTYLAGATQPAVTNSDYKDALQELGAYSFDFLVVDSMDASVHEEVSSWLAERWGIKADEVQAHLAAATNETLSELKQRSKALQDPNVSLWFQDPTRDGEVEDPWIESCVAAGTQAGMAPGTPLTWKSMRVDDLTQNTGIKIHGDDAETLVEYGVSFGRYWDGAFRVVRCLSTWTNDDTWYLISPNVRYAIARTEKLIRSYVKTRHFGQIGVEGDAKSIKSTIIDALEDAQKQGLIVAGKRRVNGILEDIPAFDVDQIFVDRDGNSITHEQAYTPVDGNDFFISGSRVLEWIDAA